MKIGIVLPDVPTYSETFFKNKIAGLQNEGYQVVVFTQYTQNKNSDYHHIKGPRKSKFVFTQAIKTILMLVKLGFFNRSSIIKFVKLERENKRGWSAIVKSAYFSSHILSQKLDWLHFGFATMTLGKENVAKAIGAKMSMSVRGYDISIYPIKNKGCYQQLWSKLNKIHVISDDLKDKLFEHGFSNQCEVVKITPAINMDVFFSERNIVATPQMKILSVGRLHWKKGFDYAIKALALLHQNNVDFTYTIIGGGVELEHLKYMVHTLGIENKVIFKGILKPDEVVEELKHTEVYLQPSVQEGFCNAVLEAQASGCLCLVSDAEGLSENVLDGKSGWVFHRRNISELKEKLENIMQMSVEEKQNIIQYAQKRVQKEFNLSKQRQEFVDFFKN